MSPSIDRAAIAEALRLAGKSTLPGHMGIEVVEISEGAAILRCEVQPFHIAPNGYLHAGSVITLADTAAGYGCMGNLLEGGTGFTTIELKANFVGTMLEGVMVAEAGMLHGGRTTQVWDVTVRNETSGKPLAHFRCTQLILYPPP